MYPELQIDRQLCFRLYTASRLVTGAYTPMLTALGITYPQYLVLLVLWEKDRQPVGEIARRLLLETNTITPLLQRMEKQGLLSRTRGESDRRQQIVALTDKGRALQEQALTTVPRGLGLKLSACPLGAEDYRQLAEGLDQIIATLSQQ
ncbi:MAG: MarR family transcriptional regulator [Bacteroidales bacterium]|nr:MarR family transcriptional regulator [Bacteroidales bacterium]